MPTAIETLLTEVAESCQSDYLGLWVSLPQGIRPYYEVGGQHPKLSPSRIVEYHASKLGNRLPDAPYVQYEAFSVPSDSDGGLVDFYVAFYCGKTTVGFLFLDNFEKRLMISKEKVSGDSGFSLMHGTLSDMVFENVRRLFEISREERAESVPKTKYDAVSGLLGRRGMEKYMEANGHDVVAYAAFDIDGLSDINDRHGHATGDSAVAALAGILHSSKYGRTFKLTWSSFAMVFVDGQDPFPMADYAQEAVAKTVLETPEWDPFRLSITHGTGSTLEEAFSELRRRKAAKANG